MNPRRTVCRLDSRSRCLCLCLEPDFKVLLQPRGSPVLMSLDSQQGRWPAPHRLENEGPTLASHEAPTPGAVCISEHMEGPGSRGLHPEVLGRPLRG